ncbi:hypothetical protein DIPPA_32017 [Diplonema papillatum]|nr:hypothetical protein DIPPA_32017 [Diplonema papillatum]KAJ9469456.1 hypothetical protein DIPPA_32017 [Diplonema papillatum]
MPRLQKRCMAGATAPQVRGRGFVEPDAWESVSRMQASADDEVPLSAWPQVGAAALEAPPAVMPLMRLAARFGVSQQNQRQLAEREQRRRAALESIWKESERKAVEAVEKRKRAEEDRVRRLEEQKRVKELELQQRERERSERLEHHRSATESMTKRAQQRDTELQDADGEKDRQRLDAATVGNVSERVTQHRNQLAEEARAKLAAAQASPSQSQQPAAAEVLGWKKTDREVEFAAEEDAPMRVAPRSRTIIEVLAARDVFAQKAPVAEFNEDVLLGPEPESLWEEPSLIDALEYVEGEKLIEPQEEHTKGVRRRELKFPTLTETSQGGHNPYRRTIESNVAYGTWLVQFDCHRHNIELVAKSPGFLDGLSTLIDMKETGRQLKDEQIAYLIKHGSNNATHNQSSSRYIEDLGAYLKDLPAAMCPLTMTAFFELCSKWRHPDLALRLWNTWKSSVSLSNSVSLTAARAMATPGLIPRTGYETQRAKVDKMRAFDAAISIFDEYYEEIFTTLVSSGVFTERLHSRKSVELLTNLDRTLGKLIIGLAHSNQNEKAAATYEKIVSSVAMPFPESTSARIWQLTVRELKPRPEEALQLLDKGSRRDELDYRRIIIAFCKLGNVEKAEEVYTMLPPIHRLDDRMRTLFEFILGYSKNALYSKEVKSHTERLESFRAGVASVKTRFEKLRDTAAEGAVRVSFPWNTVLKGLLPFYDAYETSDDRAHANREIMKWADEIRGEAQWDPDGPPREIDAAATLLMSLYVKAGDKDRADRLFKRVAERNRSAINKKLMMIERQRLLQRSAQPKASAA